VGDSHDSTHSGILWCSALLQRRGTLLASDPGPPPRPLRRPGVTGSQPGRALRSPKPRAARG
jgi:hypothetical protein